MRDLFGTSSECSFDMCVCQFVLSEKKWGIYYVYVTRQGITEQVEYVKELL